jgi:pimeloyl-ACP methyl ester carboxylesterase
LKSSSQLFPVALVSAEYKAGIYEDVYSLKPNNSQDRTVELAVVRLHKARVQPGRPLLFVHDAYHNHWQWLDYHCQGIAGERAKAGNDVWLMDWRYHGLSARNERYHLNTLRTMAHYDLPALIAFIHEQTGQYPALIGVGFGCEMIALAMADNRPVPQALFLNPSRLLPAWRYYMPLAKAMRRLRLGRSPWHKGPGEEMEHRALLLDLLAREGWLGRWRTESGAAVRPALQHQGERISWVLEGGSVPLWMHRLGVSRDRIFTGSLTQQDWQLLLPHG